MRHLLTDKEFKALLAAKEIAVAEARAQVQKELEAVKDQFCDTLVKQTDIAQAFSGVGGRTAYEAWRDKVREVVRTLKMPQ